jgi:hypothetical protein
MILEQKIRDVLAQLATVSEAPASSFEPRTSHGSSSSKVPPGTAAATPLTAADPDRPPDKERSLHDWWHWRFTKAIVKGESEFQVYRLCLLAERDYVNRRYHIEDSVRLRSGELTDNDVQDGGAAERSAAERVVDLYEGMPAVEVAVHEYATEEWVKKARRQHGRDPQSGRPRPEFLDWDEPRRYREVATLHARGMGQKKAADKLGIAKSTLQRYWPAAVAAA